MIRVAINGYGRIGRNVLRALYESGREKEFTLVAVNNFGDVPTLAHLTHYDTTHGRFPFAVRAEEHHLVVKEDKIQVFSERDPTRLPWKRLGIDVVLECTGSFTSRDQAASHLTAGAKKVLISAPAGQDVPTIVYGVNHAQLRADDRIVSNASCTTNCLVPVVKPLHEALGVVSGLMTTVHAVTNDQVLVDGYHRDWRRARAAMHSMIPTKTGAAAAIGWVLPELEGKLDGLAVRVPVLNVSLVDLTLLTEKSASKETVNQIMQHAAQTDLKEILVYTDLPLVSSDWNHHPASAIFDGTQTKVVGSLIKVLAWYDNEWGFSNRMLDTALAMARSH